MTFFRLAPLILIIAISSCSRIQDPVVATVDGQKITASDLLSEMEMERGKFDPALLSQEENFTEFRKQALEKLIQERMLIAEANRIGISLTREEKKDIETILSGTLIPAEGKSALTAQGVNPKAWRKAQERRLLIQKLISHEVLDKVPLPEERVKSYYQTNMQEFRRPAQYRARQIIVESRELADEILAKLKQGENFAELARQHSISPDSRRGGDLGFFDAASYPPIFAEVCGQLKIGEMSDVIQTDYGYQIFELLEKRPARVIPYEEAAGEIGRRLREEGSEKIFADWFAKVRDKSQAAIDEDALKGVVLEETR